MQSRAKKRFGRWGLSPLLAVFVVPALFVTILYLAISLPPASGQTPNADSVLLTQQLEFILKMNSVFLGFLGVSGSLAAYFFGKSFKDFQDFAKENIREIYNSSEAKMENIRNSSEVEIKNAVESIRKKAEAEISYLIDNDVRETVRTEVRNVQRMLQREKVISATSVDYYLPGGTPSEEPREVALLNAREFKNVEYFTKISDLRPETSGVVVLDLIHFLTPSQEKFTSISDSKDRDKIAKPIVDELLEKCPSSVLIVYVNSYPRLGCIDLVPEDRYILAANSPITVVGNAADGAYVAKGDRLLAK
ncbi:MAG: hypothetical protein WA885_14390 [Phormidesmis sp.]